MVEDAVVAKAALEQEGVVTIDQLRRAGLSRNAIRHRVEHALLQRLWRGVYLLGPLAPGPMALAMAATLTTRGAAAVSYRWGAGLWGFYRYSDLPVDVTVAQGSHRGRPEVRVHRTVLLHPGDFRRIGNVLVTSPARTLLDVATVLGQHAFEAAVAEAQVLKLVTERELRTVADRSGRHPGVPNLTRVLDGGPHLTRSEAERVLLRLLRAARLPEPLVNVKVLAYEVDFLWPGRQVIVEVDGYAFHGHRAAFERDSRRRAELAARGYVVVPVTWRQLTEEPHAVVATIAAALAQSSRTAGAGEFARLASDSIPLAGSGREK